MLEEQLGERRGRPSENSENNQEYSGRTDQIAAGTAGFDNERTYRRASSVVENGAPELVDAMDQAAVRGSQSFNSPTMSEPVDNFFRLDDSDRNVPMRASLQ